MCSSDCCPYSSVWRLGHSNSCVMLIELCPPYYRVIDVVVGFSGSALKFDRPLWCFMGHIRIHCHEGRAGSNRQRGESIVRINHEAVDQGRELS